MSGSSTLPLYVLVMAGGAIGALLRYALGQMLMRPLLAG